MKDDEEYISYAESIRRLKEVWDNEPVTFAGGIKLNQNDEEEDEEEDDDDECNYCTNLAALSCPHGCCASCCPDCNRHGR